MNDTEYLYNLLDESYYTQRIKQCNTVNEIEKLVKDRKYAQSIRQFILIQKQQTPQFLIIDDLPEATDNGYIPIEVELSDEQVKQYL